ncbi:hypothetical protein LPTSP1_20200 [Leptospira johnsonii]|uniref:Uncharacterized protein n=1 Tax=Leptospira johnsonii TaxID=1917820 RepID=A0A2P2D364_9LEPT|nr:hypothetical protein LPTSP1_20200 [Leptospira johnsonii]
MEQEINRKKVQKSNTRFLFFSNSSEVMPTSIFKELETGKANEKLRLSVTRLFRILIFELEALKIDT